MGQHPLGVLSIGIRAYAPDIRFNHLGVRSWLLIYSFCICTHIVYTHGFHDPPMFDVFNIDVWKVRMSAYLKAIGLHVFLAATKKSYLGNSKHIEANAQALMALRNTLRKDYLSIVSHCDSAFAVWNS